MPQRQSFLPRRTEAGAPAARQFSERLRSEQVAMLYRSGPVGIIAAALGAFVLARLAQSMAHRAPVFIEVWLGVIAVTVTCHLGLVRAYRRSGSKLRKWRYWGRCFTACAAMEGLIWGASGFYSATPALFQLQLLTMLVVCAVASGAVSAFGAHFPSFCALFLPATLPFVVTMILSVSTLPAVAALLVCVYCVGTFLVGIWYHGLLAETIRLRFENFDLAQGMQIQKDAAEAANLAKSRFLAAASHDLRQPVHALSLFVGALSAQDLPPVAQRLVANIDASVTVLDALFGALLDISRLDAGVVEPRLQAFPVQFLFDRLSPEFAAEAAAKNISLRFLPCSATILSDPFLLERILRNLIANAVRYTDRGKIVVGARQGGIVRLQVWDTGRGIPLEAQEAVFQEFFQLHNPERDREQGLGLGLAIVRRLTRLLDHPMAMRSIPGQGTMFSLSIPGAPAIERPAVTAAIPHVTPRRGLIIVIDDEKAIQLALRSLLESWGHTVMTAGSGTDMMALLAECPACPDLVICDYRLRDGENGISVIRQLQADYNEAFPALLITGDTAADRLAEAHQSGLKLLHKPVANARLQAAIEELLDLRMVREDQAA
jgi:signal transduction histidine kinase/CheY-like chemotaxis protein